jgi:hypothetical protein
VAAVGNATQSLIPSEAPAVKRIFQPPEFLGWAVLSVGVVLILHAFSMKKPE